MNKICDFLTILLSVILFRQFQLNRRQEARQYHQQEQWPQSFFDIMLRQTVFQKEYYPAMSCFESKVVEARILKFDLNGEDLGPIMLNINLIKYQVSLQ